MTNPHNGAASARDSTSLPLVAVSVLGGTFGLFYVLSVVHLIGDSSCTTGHNWWSLLFNTLRLFVVEGDWTFALRSIGGNQEHQLPAWFRNCRLLQGAATTAPLVLGFSLVYAFSRSARKYVLRVWRHWLTKKHTLIVGGSPSSHALIRSLQEKSLEEDYETSPPIIDVDTNPAHAEKLWALHATVLPATTGLSAAVQRHFDVRNNDRVISFLGDEDQQVALILSIRALCDDKRAWDGRRARFTRSSSQEGDRLNNAVPPVEIWFEVPEPSRAGRILALGRWNLLETHLRLGTFDFDTLAARELFDRVPLDLIADYQQQRQVHLAIHGSGPTALAIAREAAHHLATASDPVLAVTFFGEDAAKTLAALAHDAPGLGQVVDFGSCMSLEECEGRPTVTAHVVLAEEEADAVADAVRLRKALIDTESDKTNVAAPIYVRVRDAHGFGRLLRQRKPGTWSVTQDSQDDHDQPWPVDGIEGFGALEDLATLGQIASPQIEAMARRLHEFSYATFSLDKELGLPDWTRQAQNLRPAVGVDYDSLTHELRESNRRAVRHISVKARAIRCAVVQAAEDGRRRALSVCEWDGLLDEEWSRRLADAEHRRWWAERAINGWILGDGHRSDLLRHHPEFLPFNSLVGRVKEYDRRQIASLPTILGGDASAADPAAVGLRPQLVVAVIGYSRRLEGIETDQIKEAIAATLAMLRDSEAGSPVGFAPLLLSNLALGADEIAVEVADDLCIPVHGILPMPVDIYAEFLENHVRANNPSSEDRARDAKHVRMRFQRLTARTQLCVSIPTEGAPPRSLLPVGSNELAHAAEALRIAHFRRAAELIAARADVMIAIADRSESNSLTLEIAAASAEGKLCREIAPSAFHFPGAQTAPIYIDVQEPCAPSKEQIERMLNDVMRWRTSRECAYSS